MAKNKPLVTEEQWQKIAPCVADIQAVRMGRGEVTDAVFRKPKWDARISQAVAPTATVEDVCYSKSTTNGVSPGW